MAAIEAKEQQQLRVGGGRAQSPQADGLASGGRFDEDEERSLMATDGGDEVRRGGLVRFKGRPYLW